MTTDPKPNDQTPSNTNTTTTSPDSQDFSSSLYEVKPIPNKGLGAIATAPIPRGTLILREKPLFTTASLPQTSSPTVIEKSLAQILRDLPKPSQRSFLSLHNAFPTSGFPLSNTVRTNAYPLGPNSSIGGLFPEIARLNHSCVPNAVHAWHDSGDEEDENSGFQTVFAVRDIEPGEEITLSYHPGGPRRERQGELKSHFGFTCTCTLCSLPSEQAAQSDARLTRAAALDTRIGDPKRVALHPEAALHDVHELLRIYKEEGIEDLRVQRAYWDAFQVVGMHGDTERARVFARRGREGREIAEGRGSREARSLKSLEERPGQWENWEGGSKRWRNEKGVGEGVEEGSEEFERWLWREA